MDETYFLKQMKKCIQCSLNGMFCQKNDFPERATLNDINAL